MKSKRSHKLRSIRDAAGIVAASVSITDAAKRLGVHWSTVDRWIKAGKVPAPRTVPAVRPAEPLLPGQNPSEWAETIKAERELSTTDLELLDMAVGAAAVARDKNLTESVRLLAMGRYQSLVKQLHLENGGKRETVPEPSRAAVTPTRRVTHDPRRILQAVK